jgi:predicted TIM-barrel fold metal-dependent hydrolase
MSSTLTPRRRLAILLILIGVLIAVVAGALLLRHRRGRPLFSEDTAPFPKGAHRRVDAHAHLMVGALPQIEKLMDRYGFEHIVDLSGGTPDTNLEAHLAQAKASGGKITVFMTLPGIELRRPGFGERIASMLARAQEMGARGLKVYKGLGLGYLDPQDRRVAIDDPRLDPVFDAAGRLHMPVAIHTADPKAFWNPVDESNERFDELKVHPDWAMYGQPVPSWSELLDELERRIDRHPDTTFIAVHFGCAAEEPERVARMLRKYPNLYVDTAARFPEIGRHPSSEMRKMFIEFQDRILYGTDLGVGIDPLDIVTGSSGEEVPTLEEVDRFFSSSYRYLETSDPEIPSPTPIQGDWNIHGVGLPSDVLEKIYWQNATRILLSR